MSIPNAVNISEKLLAIDELWKPRIAGHYNGNEIRISKAKGEFPWHSHADTDELFLVISGELTVEFRDGERVLKSGEFIVVPKGVEHRTKAANECHMMFMDRAGEPNTGGSQSDDFTLKTLGVV